MITESQISHLKALKFFLSSISTDDALLGIISLGNKWL